MDLRHHTTGTDADVMLLDLGDGENRFNPTTVAQLNDVLDQIEAAIESTPGPRALVTTGSGKIFSNGIDLDWMLTGNDGGPVDDPMGFVGDMIQVWARIMALPIPTIAAVNGHAFAGGAMFSLAHDHVLMRSDRGYWCVNEVLLQMRLAPGMQAILSHRLPAPTARRAILTAHRFDAPAALASGIADEIHADADLRPRALEFAASLAHTANPILGVLKEDLHAAPLATMRAGAGSNAF